MPLVNYPLSRQQNLLLSELWTMHQAATQVAQAAVDNAQQFTNRYNDALGATRGALGIDPRASARIDFTTGVMSVEVDEINTDILSVVDEL